MSIQHNYEVDLNWIENRMGVVFSPELNDEVNVATPPQFPGGIDKIWSPEHLFTAAVNSCLMTTFLAIADNSKLQFSSFSSKASGKLEMVDGKYMMSEVTLMPRLVIDSEADKEKAERILTKAEAACLISNSIRSKIIFEPQVIVKEQAATTANT
jgi:peroxiredoxin-like protein